jgi:hypothetical protein
VLLIDVVVDANIGVVVVAADVSVDIIFDNGELELNY